MYLSRFLLLNIFLEVKAMHLMLLSPTEYAKLQELCDLFDNYLAVSAIIAGETPAQVYVDDMNIPTVALLFPWDGHRVYLVGETHNEQLIQEIKRALFSFFSPFKKQGRSYEFLIYYASSLWEPHFSSLCEGMETRVARRQYYGITQVLPRWQEYLPAAWLLRRIDAQLLGEQQLRYLPELIEEVHSESPSVQDFLARKFGYCVQEDHTLLGWCLSEYNHEDRCEVGIETMSQYRKLGVGVITASALIAHALAQGITKIGWHCWKDNEPSSALAIKLGGTLVAEYAVQREFGEGNLLIEWLVDKEQPIRR